MRAARSEGLIPSGPGQSSTPSWGPSTSSNPFSCSARRRRSRTASQGRRISAPIIGGPGAAGCSVKRLYEFDVSEGTPAPPAHSHDSWEETIYGLHGTLTWTVDGVATDVGPGEVLCI